jgi:hypothetical protein
MIDRPRGAFYILVKTTQCVAVSKLVHRWGEINNRLSLEKEHFQ